MIAKYREDPQSATVMILAIILIIVPVVAPVITPEGTQLRLGLTGSF